MPGQSAPALAVAFGWQSVLDSAGPQAARIEDLWWVYFWVCAAVFVLVFLALVMAVFRGRRGKGDPTDPGAPHPPASERRLTRTVAGATAATAVILIGLLVATVAASRATSSLPGDPLTIELTGQQWWWQVRYEDPTPSRMVTTANEIHIPVGRPVRVKTRSTDVIHSFWVPNLHGKRDLIPGRPSEILIQADRPGVFRGQCAEFCGYQHANMALLVVAEPPETFAAWYEAQLQPARPPSDALQQRGKVVFEALPCPLCHTIAGTQASGKTAPDLTHLASRRMLAAGTLPNTRGHLGGWILDPQTIKPGNKMPAVSLGSDDLRALLAYLESLR
ncbi:MAG TPA: cytochrome c oxidase subunit II [Thermoanaerobaculia bacterium]